MKALCIKQPWAGWIYDRSKRLEIRSRPTAYRGQLLIVASKVPDWAAISPAQARDLPKGVALCIVHLTDCRPMTKDDTGAACTAYFNGRWAYVLEDVIRIRQPFPVHGQLGFFNVELPNGLTLEPTDSHKTEKKI